MVDYASFKYGGVTFPLTTSTARSALQDCDPAVFYALEFLRSVITTYIQPRMLIEAAACGLGTAITKAVASIVPFDPAEHFVKAQIPLPLLAVYPTEEDNSTYRTTTKSHIEATFGVAYALPPLSSAQSQRMEPFLRAISKLLNNRVEAGWDPAYTPSGGTLGQQAWKLAGIERIDYMGARFVAYQGLGELWFPALLGTFRVKEMQGAQLGAVAFAGADIDEQIDPGGGGAVVDNVVTIKSDVVVPKPGP